MKTYLLSIVWAFLIVLFLSANAVPSNQHYNLVEFNSMSANFTSLSHAEFSTTISWYYTDIYYERVCSTTDISFLVFGNPAIVEYSSGTTAKMKWTPSNADLGSNEFSIRINLVATCFNNGSEFVAEDTALTGKLIVNVMPSTQLSVLTYNTALLSAHGYAQPCVGSRARAIAEAIRDNYDFDVLLLQETFDNGPTTKLIDILKAKYPYYEKDKPDGDIFNIGGGLTIMSKYALTYKREHKWDTCHGLLAADCFANKGYYRAKITKHHVPINLLTLHAQADVGYNKHVSELNEVTQGLNDVQVICPDCLHIVAGDFNFPGPKSGYSLTGFTPALYDRIGWLFNGDRNTREVWREATCSAYGWGVGANGTNGATKNDEAPADRIDFMVYNDSVSGKYEMRPGNVRVIRFDAVEEGKAGIACSASGFPEDYTEKAYSTGTLSDHYAIAAMFTIYGEGNPSISQKNIQCGPI